MKIFRICAISAGLALSVAGVNVGAEVVDRVLATVGSEPILQSDVMAEAAPQLNQLRRTVAGTEEFNREAARLMDAVLQDLIEGKILLREAKLAGLSIRPEAIDMRINERKKLYESTDAFMKDLEAAGLTLGDLRTYVEKRLMALAMADRKLNEFKKEVVIAESAVAQYYDDNKDRFVRPERVLVRQIFLAAAPDAASRGAARGRLEQLKDEINAGADFAELAKAHSEGPGAADGGLMGWMTRGDLVDPLDAAAFALEAGQVSDILETDNGVHLLYVVKKESAGLASFEEVRAEIEPELRTQAAAGRYRKWMGELRKRSRVQVFRP